MPKPNNPHSTGQLSHALARLGSVADARQEFVDLLLRYEPKLVAMFDGINVREEITGPIVDAMHDPAERLKRELASGLALNFHYTSKIARDFVMARDKNPDHVWEPQTTKAVLHLSAAAKEVVIGGAYFGDHAISVAKTIQSKGRCHCFELNSENCDLLRLNAAENGISNLIANQIGLWSSTTRLSLVGSDSHATPVAKSDGQFQATTISEYGKERNIAAFDLIMLDIEGGEFEALKGAHHYLKMPPPNAPNLIFEVHRSYVDWSNGLAKTDIMMFLADLGYQAFAIRDYQGNMPMANRPIELVDIESVYLDGPPHGFNMLASKDPNVFKNPAFRLCKAVSPKLLSHRNPALHSPLS